MGCTGTFNSDMKIMSTCHCHSKFVKPWKAGWRLPPRCHILFALRTAKRKFCPRDPSGPEELRLKNDHFHNALCHSVCNIRTVRALHNVHSCSPERHEQHILCVGRQLWADLHPLKPLWAAPSSDADVHVVQLGSSLSSSGSCNARSHIRLQQLPNIPCGGKRVARACGCRQ